MKRVALVARDRDEHHRAATPLELFYDLASVVAIAAAAHGLRHSIADAHAIDGIFSFVVAFFSIWWAWMNYTWFASAYDDGSVTVRTITMVIVFGALMMAAGIPMLFEKKPYLFVWLGFVVMRLGQVALWMMAARGDPARRQVGQRYAAGITAAQVYWTVLFLAQVSDTRLFMVAFAVGVAIELLVPVYAEAGTSTPWHRHHITERYGLLNIIVLGEIMLSIVLALRQAQSSISLANPLVHVAISASVITFSLWWIYFSRDEHLTADNNKRAFVWGYGHVIIFGAGAALGAGFGVLIDILTNHAKISLRAGDIAVAVPLALYLAGLWFVRDRFLTERPLRHILLVGAIGILVAGFFLPASLEVMTLITLVVAVFRSR